MLSNTPYKWFYSGSMLIRTFAFTMDIEWIPLLCSPLLAEGCFLHFVGGIVSKETTKPLLLYNWHSSDNPLLNNEMYCVKSFVSCNTINKLVNILTYFFTKAKNESSFRTRFCMLNNVIFLLLRNKIRFLRIY